MGSRDVIRGYACAGVVLTVATILGSSAASAQAAASADELVVAVPGLRALHGDDDAANELTGWLRAAASTIDGWRLHSTVASLEQFMLVNGCDAPHETCLAAVAKTLDVDRIISGSFSRVLRDDGYVFDAELFIFDAETGQIERTSEVRLEPDRVRPGELAVVGQREVDKLAGAESTTEGARKPANQEPARMESRLDVAQVVLAEPEKRFPIWPAAVSYASGAAFIGLTAWSWVTIRNVEEDPAFQAARQLAGPEVNDVCRAESDFGISNLDSLCAKANTHETLQWVFLGLGAASVGVGTWLLVKSVRSGKSADRARLEVTPVAGRRLGGVSARLRF
ncbi:MAG: hypothetical protein AAF997_17555 [Myxococcota bacterium]